MSRPSFPPSWIPAFAVLLGLALFAAGCTTPKIDWNARVGQMTYDQALLEIGPPDKSAKLTDGTIVAEWLIRRGYYGTSAFYTIGPVGPPYSYYGGAPIIVTGPGPQPDRFLRLIFAPDGKLQSWLKFSR